VTDTPGTPELLEGRDLSRVRTQARLIELELLGLLAMLPEKEERTPAIRNLATALSTAREMSWRTQQALDAALSANRVTPAATPAGTASGDG
jgi:hypothetical protein